MVLFTLISTFLNAIVAIIFGLLSWLHNPKGKANRLVALMGVSIAVWAISWGIQAPIRDQKMALFWGRMVNFGAIFIPIFFLHWVLSLLETDKEKKNKIILFFGYLLTLFFAVFAFTPYFVADVKPNQYFYYYEEPGILYHFYLLFCYGGLVVYALYNLFKSYKQASDHKKSQIKYVFLGSALGFGGGATNYFLFYNIPIPPFGNPLVAVGFGLLVYATIKHHLMDIKILTTELLTAAIWVALFVRTILSKTQEELLINLSLLVLVVFLGVLLIRSVFKEIKLTKQLLEKSEKELDFEKRLHSTFEQIAEERARRLERAHSQGVEGLNLERRVKELEEKLEEKSKKK